MQPDGYIIIYQTLSSLKHNSYIQYLPFTKHMDINQIYQQLLYSSPSFSVNKLTLLLVWWLGVNSHKKLTIKKNYVLCNLCEFYNLINMAYCSYQCITYFPDESEVSWRPWNTKKHEEEICQIFYPC